MTSQIRGQLNKQYLIPQRYAKSKANIYQLGCTFYLASLVYEMLYEYENSYTALRKLQRINPNFIYGIQDLYYKASRAGFADEAGKWKSQLGYVPSLTRKSGSVVVFYQCDRGPQKREISFVVPTGVGFQKVAIPAYFVAPTVGTDLDLRIGKQKLSTAILTDINFVALRYHRDKSLAVAARMAVRLAAKNRISTWSLCCWKLRWQQTKSCSWVIAQSRNFGFYIFY